MEKIVRIQYLVLETAYFSNIKFSESLACGFIQGRMA